MSSLLSPLLLLLLYIAAVSAAATPASTASPAAPRTSALLAACAHKRVSEALALVDAAAAADGGAGAAAAAASDLDAPDLLGWTPLMLAAMSEELDEVARRLVAAGARLDATNQRGLSALHLACHKQRAPAALLLVESGAALDLLDVRSKTALDYCDAGGEAMAGVSAAIRAAGGRLGEELAEAGTKMEL